MAIRREGQAKPMSSVNSLTQIAQAAVGRHPSAKGQLVFRVMMLAIH